MHTRDVNRSVRRELDLNNLKADRSTNEEACHCEDTTSGWLMIKLTHTEILKSGPRYRLAYCIPGMAGRRGAGHKRLQNCNHLHLRTRKIYLNIAVGPNP